MDLQLALDQVTLDEAVGVVTELQDLIDIVEIGTPLIIREGLKAVAVMKKRFPALTVLADVKIVDGGQYESQISFEAGADIVTVLGLAHDVTIEAAAQEAKKNNRSIMVDLLGVADIRKRIAELERIGAQYLCVHTASDLAGSQQTPLKSLEEAVAAVRAAKVAVAGGITVETVAEVILKKPEVIIVGGGIMKQPDRRKAALRIREQLAGR